MSSGTTRVTRKGQITIPIEVRRALGLNEGDRVMVTEEGGRAIISRAQSVTERTAGIGYAYRRVPPPTIQEEKEAFAQAIVDDWLESERRMRGEE
jgi:AbrB family looped-hinge helix DNA binding protein